MEEEPRLTLRNARRFAAGGDLHVLVHRAHPWPLPADACVPCEIRFRRDAGESCAVLDLEVGQELVLQGVRARIETLDLARAGRSARALLRVIGFSLTPRHGVFKAARGARPNAWPRSPPSRPLPPRP